MIKPELLDIVEILVNLPEHNQLIGAQGTIVECYANDHFEVEFSNEDGETTALCVLSSQQFVVVWKVETKEWLSTHTFDHISAFKCEEVKSFSNLVLKD